MGRRRALRKELARHADLLQVLRLMAAASPELASMAFTFDHDAVDMSRRTCDLVRFTDIPSRADVTARRGTSAGGAMIALPSAEAYVVRLPLRPLRSLRR